MFVSRSAIGCVLCARCLDLLRRMQQSASRQNQFAKIGLSRLYDVELSAKYAYTGFLGNKRKFCYCEYYCEHQEIKDC